MANLNQPDTALDQNKRGYGRPGATRRGNLLVVSGPSGVGKGTVRQEALSIVPGIKRSISVTTRILRAGEKEGVDYFFKSEQEFQQLIDEHSLLEWATFSGCRYGTPKQWVEEQLRAGQDVVLEIEVQGAKQIRDHFPEATLIFVSPPSMEALEERLKNRATESSQKILQRLETARYELAQRSWFDYEIVNDQVSNAVEDLVHIIHAQRCKIVANSK